MIKPAQLYTEELKSLHCETWYDPKYIYYHSDIGTQELQFSDNNYERHSFAILENNEVVGYISYRVNWASKVAYNFGIIDDIFMKYKMNKMEFFAFSDNPVIKHYYNFINRFGGREVGILKESTLLMDGKLHDSVMFELFAKDYLFYKKFKKPSQIKKDSILTYDTETYIISEK